MGTFFPVFIIAQSPFPIFIVQCFLTLIMTQCLDMHMLRFLCPYFHFSQFSASTQVYGSYPDVPFHWSSALTGQLSWRASTFLQPQCLDTDRGINCPDTVLPFHSPLPRHKFMATVLIHFYPFTVHCLDTNYGNCPDTLLPFHSPLPQHKLWPTVLIHFYPFTVHCLDTDSGNCPDVFVPVHSPLPRHRLWQLSWRASTFLQSSASTQIVVLAVLTQFYPFHSPLPRHRQWQLSWRVCTRSQSIASTWKG